MVVVKNGLGTLISDWMDESSSLFAFSCIVSGKLKVTLDMHMVKYGYDLLGPGTLKSALSQE